MRYKKIKNKIPVFPFWIGRYGSIHICEMSDAYIQNAINWIFKLLDQGENEQFKKYSLWIDKFKFEQKKRKNWAKFRKFCFKNNRVNFSWSSIKPHKSLNKKSNLINKLKFWQSRGATPWWGPWEGEMMTMV